MFWCISTNCFNTDKQQCHNLSIRIENDWNLKGCTVMYLTLKHYCEKYMIFVWSMVGRSPLMCFSKPGCAQAEGLCPCLFVCLFVCSFVCLFVCLLLLSSLLLVVVCLFFVFFACLFVSLFGWLVCWSVVVVVVVVVGCWLLLLFVVCCLLLLLLLSLLVVGGWLLLVVFCCCLLVFVVMDDLFLFLFLLFVSRASWLVPALKPRGCQLGACYASSSSLTSWRGACLQGVDQ